MSVKEYEPTRVNELIEKSIEIFSIKGYESANLTDITNALGVSRGPIYYHFKDKYGLYEAAYNRYESEVREDHNRLFSQDKPVLGIIEDLIYNCIEQINRFGENFLFGLDTLDELSSIKEQYYKLAKDIYQQKLDFIVNSIEKGEIKKGIDPRVVVDSIYILYLGAQGLIFQKVLDFNSDELKSLVKVLMMGMERYCCD